MKENIDLQQEMLPPEVYLVGAHQAMKHIEYSMNELENLAFSANYNVVGKTMQNLHKINSGYYIGKGKMEEIKKELEGTNVKKLIFNEELSGIQLKNLEEYFELKIIDRTYLILEIFATRAQTKEAKMQVNVARLKYDLPRIRGSYTKFERQRGGGVANRGKGDGLINLDKKRAEEKIAIFEKELEKMNQIQQAKNYKQKGDHVVDIALVGYTNAGKSTLMNQLAKLEDEKSVFVKDLLFATLDTTSRKIDLIDNLNSVISDTVGFVDKLPTDLIKAFRSTLSAVVDADIIIHLIDSQSPYLDEQKVTTINTLEKIGVDSSKIIEVYNKCDSLDIEGELSISALNGRNIDQLREYLQKIILQNYEYIEEKIKYENYKEVIDIRMNPNVIKLTETKNDDHISLSYYRKVNS